MSDYHILHRTKIGSRYRYKTAIHVGTPIGYNAASKSWMDCIAEDDWVAKTTIVPNLDSAELALIQSGEVVERVYHPEIPTSLSDNDARDKFDAGFTTLEAIIIQGIEDRYRFWGYDRDVP